ncbi:hypothetical protein [Nocardia sp. NPDC049149]
MSEGAVVIANHRSDDDVRHQRTEDTAASCRTTEPSISEALS